MKYKDLSPQDRFLTLALRKYGRIDYDYAKFPFPLEDNDIAAFVNNDINKKAHGCVKYCGFHVMVKWLEHVATSKTYIQKVYDKLRLMPCWVPGCMNKTADYCQQCIWNHMNRHNEEVIYIEKN